MPRVIRRPEMKGAQFAMSRGQSERSALFPRHAFVVTAGALGFVLKDLYGGMDGYRTSSVGYSVGHGQLAMDGTGSSDTRAFLHNRILNKDFAMLMMIHENGETTDNYLFCDGPTGWTDDDRGNFSMYRSTQTEIRMRIGNITSNVSSIPKVSEWNVHTFDHDLNGNLFWSVNGKYVRAVGGSDFTGLTYNVLMFQRAYAGSHFSGYIGLIYVWDWAVPREILQRLGKDPYLPIRGKRSITTNAAFGGAVGSSLSGGFNGWSGGF